MKSGNLVNKLSYPKWFIDKLVNKEDKKRALLGDIKTSEILEFKCNKHGNYFQRVGDCIRRNSGNVFKEGCKVCAYEKRASSLSKTLFSKQPIYPEWFIDDIYSEKDKELARSGSLSSNQKIKFKCVKHGIYEQRVSDHIKLSTGSRKSACPMCVFGKHRSIIEDEIYEFISGFYKGKIIRNQRGIIKINEQWAELDLFLPEINVAIEVNGSYYHASEGIRVRKLIPKDYHYNKFRLCEEKGIHLVSIFDIDWYSNRRKLLLFIRDLVFKKERIYARKCSIYKVEKKEANSFYDRYHIQGGSNKNEINYGLFYKDKLVSVMSFGKERYNKSGEGYYELHRYCVIGGYTVIGGAEKLFKHFVEEYSPFRVLSYSNNDWFLGEIYKTLKFEFNGFCNPRYYWTDLRCRKEIKREKSRLREIRKGNEKLYNEATGNREDYIMTRLGYIKVYRSGNKRWIYEKK